MTDSQNPSGSVVKENVPPEQIEPEGITLGLLKYPILFLAVQVGLAVLLLVAALGWIAAMIYLGGSLVGDAILGIILLPWKLKKRLVG